MGRVRRSFLEDGRKYVVNSHYAALQCGPCCFSYVLFVWDLIEDGKSYIQKPILLSNGAKLSNVASDSGQGFGFPNLILGNKIITNPTF